MSSIKYSKSDSCKVCGGGVKCLFENFITNTAQSWYSAFC